MKFSIEAEQAIIGCLLQSPNRFDDVQEIISADDFYSSGHKIVYSSIELMSGMGKAIDVLTVTDYLIAAGDLDNTGGIGYLVELVNNNSGVANILTYARIVADRSVERRIAEAGQRVHDIAESDGMPVDDKLNAVHAEFSSLERNDRTSDIVDFNTLLKSEVQDIDGRFNKVGKPGLKIGFSALDNRFGGIEETDLWVLAARPSMGKTALALNIASNVAAQGKDVLVFSLEMSKEQLTKRLVSSSSGINYGVLRSGDLSEDDWPKLSLGVSKLKDKRIHIIDVPAIDVNRAMAIARKFSRSGNLGLVIIDYLQLMTAKSENRFDEISYISRQLKVMAKTVKAPVIALSQLSRKCEERGNKRPINSDLRESGQIEQDADIISFIYRDVVHNKDTANPDIAEIITTKFRNGETGVDGIKSELQYSRFVDLGYDFVQSSYEEEKPKSRGYNPR